MSKKDTLKALFQTSENLKPEEIKRYLGDNSSPEERFRVENQLLDDPFAADAIEGFQQHTGAMPEFNYDDFLKKVNPAAEPSAKVVNMPARRFQLRRIAAAVVLLVAAGLSFYFFSDNDQRLYSQFYEKYETSDAFINLRDDSSANVIEAELIAGLNAYDDEEYTLSIEKLEKYLQQNPESSDALFYGGLAHLEKGDFTGSVDYLMEARKVDPNYYREATWYAALACLKKNDLANAKELIQDLLKSKGRYYEKAKMLNSKL